MNPGYDVTQSISDATTHTHRLHHHMNRVREHRALIDQDATDAAVKHYADRAQQQAASGQTEPVKGAPNE
jgi:hypothetical protein